MCMFCGGILETMAVVGAAAIVAKKISDKKSKKSNEND